jgi:hypothetical protein
MLYMPVDRRTEGRGHDNDMTITAATTCIVAGGDASSHAASSQRPNTADGPRRLPAVLEVVRSKQVFL